MKYTFLPKYSTTKGFFFILFDGWASMQDGKRDIYFQPFSFSDNVLLIDFFRKRMIQTSGMIDPDQRWREVQKFQ